LARGGATLAADVGKRNEVHRGWLLTLLVGCIALSGCGNEPDATESPRAETLAPTLTPAVLEAVQLRRQELGLRFDAEWVQAVAADPASDRTSYGIPLTGAEVAELSGRLAAIDLIKQRVMDYAQAHQDEWAGGFTDPSDRGVFVAQFSGHIIEPAQALLPLARPGALEIRLVMWSLVDLRAMTEGINLRDPWFDTVPAVATGVGPDVVENKVVVSVSSGNPAATALITAHLALPPGALVVDSDGRGALLLPKGMLRIKVIGSDGTSPEGLACVAIPDVDGAYEPRPLPMPRTDQAGVCVLELPATGYWIQIEEGSAPPKVVGLERAVVTAHATTEVQIELQAIDGT
jgi:hypothetical protein